MAIMNAVRRADDDFLDLAQLENGVLQWEGGSCANFALIVENECYITNIGDSRAILSYNMGQNVE